MMPFSQLLPMTAVDEQAITAFYNGNPAVNNFGFSSAGSMDSGYGDVDPFDKLTFYDTTTDMNLFQKYNVTTADGVVPGSFDNLAFPPAVNQQQESRLSPYSNSPALVTSFQPSLAPLHVYMPFSSPSMSEDGRTGSGCGSRSSVSPSHDGMMFDNEPSHQRRPFWSESSPSLKRRATDALTDAQTVVKEEPIQKTTPSRGRPRKRIPHTAVERRYRENLNSHLEKLRAAVPNLTAAQRRKSSDGADPLKPSKCEVLMGAVEYIQRLEAENERLKQKKR